jgi:hypothetical protein
MNSRRLIDPSIPHPRYYNTVASLLVTASTVCADYQDKPGKPGPYNERGAAAEVENSN